MYRILYLSAAKGFPCSRELSDILEVSQRRNNADDITGLLLYHDGSFAQVLEGPEEPVRACYDRIKQDQRHTGCKIVFEETASERLFDGWSMAFVPPMETDATKQRGFIDIRAICTSQPIKAAMSHPVIAPFISSFQTPLQTPRRRAPETYWLKVS